jgi:hypothetical protein
MGKIGKSSSSRLRLCAVLISYFCEDVGRATRAARSTENGRIRHIPTSPAHASAARNWPGVTPVSRRNKVARWLWSANPASSAIRARG